MNSRPSQITESHLRRGGRVYLRQSTDIQKETMIGSAAVQRDLQELLIEWGCEVVEVIDEDLGKSGSVPGQRSGFDRLIEDMAAGRCGIVAVIDISRLARNEVDEALFAATARQYDVLLAVGTTIVDFRDPNSAFVGRILGLNASRENRFRIDKSMKEKREKAKQGIPASAPPVGYVRGPRGKWLKDQDNPKVVETIQRVFDKFRELGSAGAVARYLRKHGIKVPRVKRRMRWPRPKHRRKK